MKRFFLYCLALLLISGIAFAVPHRVADTTIFSSGSISVEESLVSYGGHLVNKLEHTPDVVTRGHQYISDPLATSIPSATLTLGLRDRWALGFMGIYNWNDRRWNVAFRRSRYR